MGRSSGKVAIISGGARGMGEAESEEDWQRVAELVIRGGYSSQ